MENNIFYSRGKKEEKPKKKKFDFKVKKENTLNSLNEVEYFLNNYKNISKYLKIYKTFKS